MVTARTVLDLVRRRSQQFLAERRYQRVIADAPAGQELGERRLGIWTSRGHAIPGTRPPQGLCVLADPAHRGHHVVVRHRVRRPVGAQPAGWMGMDQSSRCGCARRPASIEVQEAPNGRYWAADALEAAGAEVRLAHPLGVKAFSYRRSGTTRKKPLILVTCCGWAGCPRRGSPRPRSASCES
jgi:hypothetical protein